MKPLFSIITVTYNAQESLPTTIRSVDAQTFTDYEHIIQDGNSKDRTVEIAELADPARRRIVSAPDKGLYDAMNKAMSIASGKYLIFLNAGDSFHDSETLRRMADLITENDYPGVVYGQTDLVDIDGKYLAPRHLTAPENLTYRDFANGMLVCHQAFCALARIAPRYDTRYRLSADYDWCIKCLQHSRRNVYLPGTMIDYLYEGMSTKNRRKSLIERFRIMSHYYGFFPTLLRHLSFIPRFFSHKKTISNAVRQ